MERTKITVGMPVTRYVGSDRYPYEVVEVSDDQNHVVVREMRATPADGFDYYSNQVYTFESVDYGHTVELSRRKDGGLRPVGSSMREPTHFGFGYASFYHDPCF